MPGHGRQFWLVLRHKIFPFIRTCSGLGLWLCQIVGFKTAQEQLHSVVGSLNWLVCVMRIVISTITSMLAQHLHSATTLHVASARYVVNYLRECKSIGIKFHNATIKWHLYLPQLPTSSKQTMHTHQCQMGSPRLIRSRPVQPTWTPRFPQFTISDGLHYMAEWAPPLDLKTPFHYRPKLHRGKDLRNGQMR